MTGRSFPLKVTSLSQFRSMPTFDSFEFQENSPMQMKRPKRSLTIRERSVTRSQFSNLDEDFHDPVEKEDCKPAKQARMKKIKERKSELKKHPISAGDLEPKDSDELAVHPKKVKEVREWIEEKIKCDKGPKLLLITGPCGSGKTTTVKVLCHEMGIELVEAEHQEGGEFDFNSMEIEKADSMFFAFMRSCEYSSVSSRQSKKRLVLIEHLPNLFYRDPHRLREILSEFTVTRTMFVIIMSTIENCWDLSPSRIFSETTMATLGMQQIKFNSVAQTFMKNALKRIFALCDTRVSDACLKNIVESADGDIRSAMNTVNFSTSEKAISQHLTSSINHLSTFHYIGKIMNAKRADVSSQNWRLSENLLKEKQWARPRPPKDDINYLVEITRFTESRLADYVFEHEPNFCPSVDSGARVLRDLCELDAILNAVEFQMRPVVDHYYGEVTIRSTIFHNYRSDENAKGNFYGFQKPKIWNLKKIGNDKKLELLQKIPKWRFPDLFTTLTPLLPLVNVSLSNDVKLILDELSMAKLLGTTHGIIKINPRTRMWKNVEQEMATVNHFLTPGLEKKFNNFVIEESEDDDDW
ncbi:hypothetical protein FO519_004559 [Halicephalobus sp. NKZ332]|nr:hypothetical protein FO519_004559 [Halicephalobus sp. NKZ332]